MRPTTTRAGKGRTKTPTMASASGAKWALSIPAGDWLHRRLERVGQCPSGGAAGEDASTEERAFQSVVAVHAAASKAGDLTCGIQPGDRLTVESQCPGRQVGLDAAQGLSRQDVKLDPDERSCVGIEDAVRGCGASDAVTERLAGVADALNLGVLAKRVAQLQ